MRQRPGGTMRVLHGACTARNWAMGCIGSMKALPLLLLSDEALMQLMGFNAQEVRQGICQRGATQC